MRRYTERKGVSEITIFPDAVIPITVNQSDETFTFQNARMYPALERLCSFEEAEETARLMTGTMEQYLHRMQNMLCEIAKDNLNRYLNEHNIKFRKKLEYRDYMGLANIFVATHKGSVLKKKCWDSTIKQFLRLIPEESLKQTQHK